MDVWIKPLKEEDEEAALALLARGVSTPPSALFLPGIGVFVGKKELVALLTYGQNARERVFGGDAKAYYSFLDEAGIGERPLYFLSSFFVDPAVRGKGLGRMLESDLRKRCPGSDFLVAFARGNASAEAFFRRCGYLPVPARHERHLGSGQALYYRPSLKEGLCSKGNW